MRLYHFCYIKTEFTIILYWFSVAKLINWTFSVQFFFLFFLRIWRTPVAESLTVRYYWKELGLSVRDISSKRETFFFFYSHLWNSVCSHSFFSLFLQTKYSSYKVYYRYYILLMYLLFYFTLNLKLNWKSLNIGDELSAACRVWECGEKCHQKEIKKRKS